MAMKNHSVIRATLCSALLAVASAPLALGEGTAVWVELDNSVNPATGNPTGLDDGSYDGTVYRSFDLYVVLPPAWDTGDPQTNRLHAVDFGFAVDNAGLVTDGVYFQTPEPFESDSVVFNETLAPFDDQVYFDCSVAIGDDPITVQGGPMDWDPDGVVGSWSTTNNPGVLPGDGALLLIARVTVSADACSLGGQCFVVDDRLNNCPLCHPPPPFYIHDIPNAFRELECLGDITWDGVVDTADLGRMIRAFGTGWGDAEFNPRADLARDGVVDTADLGRLIANFGKSCD
jgi:hypothetical protein